VTPEQAKAIGECLALVEWKPGDNEWIHVTWRDEDGEGPMWDGEDIITRYWPEGWVMKGDPKHVLSEIGPKILAFAPLPEVKL
jgi:hypothetical protein